MTPRGQVLESKPGICVDGSLASSPEQATPVILEGPELFAAYVAHELRAPIALQRTLVQVALADPHADVVKLREMGERVIESCTRQQRLVDALLDLVLCGRGLERREPVDLGATAAKVLRAHDPGGLESVVVLEPAWTAGDPELLERLVANLVSNAIRHNVVGGRIEVATCAKSGRAVLSLANTGTQIEDRELRRLFQPFQRLARHQPGTAKGVGLGLAIVQAIAEAHDAVVSARACVGGGLEIRVNFPADVHTDPASRAATSR